MIVPTRQAPIDRIFSAGNDFGCLVAATADGLSDPLSDDVRSDADPLAVPTLIVVGVTAFARDAIVGLVGDAGMHDRKLTEHVNDHVMGPSAW